MSCEEQQCDEEGGAVVRCRVRSSSAMSCEEQQCDVVLGAAVRCRVRSSSAMRREEQQCDEEGGAARAVIIRERASFFLSFRHSVSQRPSSAVEDARSSAAHSFQRTRSIPHILWAGIPCQLILASRLYFRPGLLAI
ncbi:hypothetical protein NDU88_006688 [Pleurodeles waltl]|uniref:Uncharacterized protein n=1 Tax=Pleurodeles waltl TaxID=8319 RepID=A0AAV7MZZ7_PLEWA|nr:hypothetical protein NDU88_006688 [Pleurodeles waltl]